MRRSACLACPSIIGARAVPCEYAERLPAPYTARYRPDVPVETPAHVSDDGRVGGRGSWPPGSRRWHADSCRDH
jgi:hypothetical protein